MEKGIYLFRGARSIYSNMYPCIVKYDGKEFKSAEAAYQYCKLKPKDRDSHRALTLLITDGYRAKEYGRTIPLNKKSWERNKEKFMYDVLKCKFDQHPDLKEKLIAEERILVDGSGKNKLGKLLMRLREDYINQLKK